MTPKEQLTARDIVSTSPSEKTKKLFQKVLKNAQKDQEALLKRTGA